MNISLFNEGYNSNYSLDIDYEGDWLKSAQTQSPLLWGVFACVIDKSSQNAVYTLVIKTMLEYLHLEHAGKGM